MFQLVLLCSCFGFLGLVLGIWACRRYFNQVDKICKYVEFLPKDYELFRNEMVSYKLFKFENIIDAAYTYGRNESPGDQPKVESGKVDRQLLREKILEEVNKIAK